MKKSALVIDDNSYIRKNIKDILEDLDFEVFEAGDGLEGIEQFKKFNPSIVIMDINMPNLNGIKATEEIIKINKDALIAICSSMLFIPYYQNLAKAAGAKSLISKPFTKNEFIFGLNSLLEMEE